MNNQCGLYASGISLSGYGYLQNRWLGKGVRGRHEVGAVEPDAPVSGASDHRDQVVHQCPPHPAVAMRRLDVHALELGGIGPDALHADRADSQVADERHQEATVGRLEPCDGGEIVVDLFARRVPEAVPRLHLVVSPREVLEPQARGVFQISRQIGFSRVPPLLGRG